MTVIIKVNVNARDYESTANQAIVWARSAESRYICIANVHMLMEAWDSPEFAALVNSADLVTPDGIPLVWMLRLKGQRDQGRVYGPTLMLHILEAAARENMSVGFYGSRPDVLQSLIKRMQAKYPPLNVTFAYSPPFRDLSQNEDDEIIQKIRGSGVQILFVGLGCPRQEKWMASHRGRVSTVMIGVGAAFDFHAGTKSQAPAWMQGIGFEWLFRLVTEPRRLWPRYFYTNPRFIFLAIVDLLGLLR